MINRTAIICVFLGLVLLAGCSNHTDTYYIPSESLSVDKEEAMESQLISRLQSVICEIKPIDEAVIDIRDDGTTRTVWVEVAASAILTQEQKSAIVSMIENSFTEQVSVEIHEVPN